MRRNGSPGGKVPCHLANAESDFLHMPVGIMLEEIHRHPVLEGLFGYRAVAGMIDAFAERVRAARECGALLEKVEKINWPTAGNLVGFVGHAFRRQRAGELLR